MIQGAGSNVGKSLIVAGLCRAARARGLSVAPFKPQNMSNNAAVTADGGEIGRAQALQARAAGIAPVNDMNPVLLKPETETGAQVIVQGQRWQSVRARDYAALKPALLQKVMESFNRLRAGHDLVIIEGAGSPAEVNLRAGDIANMGFARAADVPVILTGDIDRGGVIAQMIGTQAVLDPKDNAMIAGFLINKFRGDPTLFKDGYHLIAERTGWPGFGVLPWFSGAHRLPAEDAADIRFDASGTGRPSSGQCHIVALGLSRIANFDDLDPLAAEPDVRLTLLRAGQVLPGDADLVIIPGTKSTRADLDFIRAQGWDIDLKAHHRRGGAVLGICGGYQMLGEVISDPHGFDGDAGDSAGLGLLRMSTVMGGDKRVTEVSGTAFSVPVTGYEIHLGQSHGPDTARPFAQLTHGPDGAISADGRVMGSYLHGLFSDDRFRAAFLARLGATSQPGFEAGVEAALDDLAAHIESHVDTDRLFALAH